MKALSKDALQSKIHTIRGVQVMLDRDLAELYEVKPTRLREQVKRNIKRFPDDFMFQLTSDEVETMVSQNAIPSRKVLGGHLPYVFTEQGVAGLSGVLTSQRAIEVNIQIMRAFVEMRRFMQNNAVLFHRLDIVEQRQVQHQLETDRKFEQVFQALESGAEPPRQGIFFDGQVFDAYRFVNDLIRTAKRSIVLIDNYIDDTTLTLFSKRPKAVKVVLHTKTISKKLKLDLEKFNAQYPPIEIKEFKAAHDRFMIIDDNIVYHIGASLKDLGKKWFAFSRIEIDTMIFLNSLTGFATNIINSK